MINPIYVSAPAKINLFLHVIGQRLDGYHLLQSVFQLIDLEDTVCLHLRDDSQIRRINPIEGVAVEDDLVIKAARLLKKVSKAPQGVEIGVEKRIPMGAGLGGGSSDAASTLLGLNYLWKLNLSLDNLMEIGVQLGADVPFFIQGNNAFVEGIGEIIRPLDLPTKKYLIIYPGVAIPTKDIFSDPNLTRNHSKITMSDFAGQNSNQICFKNDLQEIAELKYVDVKNAIKWLSHTIIGSNPLMSGSGSSVFCEIPNTLNIDNCLLKLPQHWKGYIVESLMQHSAYNLIPNKDLMMTAQQGSRQVG